MENNEITFYLDSIAHAKIKNDQESFHMSPTESILIKRIIVNYYPKCNEEMKKLYDKIKSLMTVKMNQTFIGKMSWHITQYMAEKSINKSVVKKNKHKKDKLHFRINNNELELELILSRCPTDASRSEFIASIIYSYLDNPQYVRERIVFKNELEIVQKNVDVWYEQTVEKSTDEIMLGSPITADRKTEFDSLITKVAQIVNNSGDQNSSKTVTVKTDINRYRYFGENEFTDLQIDGIENEYLIDIKSQVAIFIGGYEFEDIKYYMLDQIRDVTRGGSSIGEYIKISSFSIESNIEMTYKDKRTIIADIKPENANEELTWSSSNTEVVDVKGVTGSNNMAELTANDQGTALIRVSNKSLTIIKECKVTVKKKLVTTLTAFQSEKVEAVDRYGNCIVVPKGFRYVEGDNIKNGIVIEDEEGNQFVWIPVSNISSSDVSNEKNVLNYDGSKFLIFLGRYNKLSNGSFSPEQLASDYSKESELTIDNIKYREISTSSQGTSGSGNSGNNATAFDLNGFISSVEKNKGFYYARYEASKGSDGKAKSKANQNAWTGITQLEASSKSRSMYTTNNGVRTDLINSYAWSTALEYINKMGSSDYINKKNTVTSILKTGQSGDKACNIYDMSGNISEWTTETATNSTGKCTYIGGGIGQQQGTAFSRYVSDTVSKSNSISFRVIMYIDN